MAHRGLVATLTLLVLVALVVALAAGFVIQKNPFYPPTPLVIASTATYEKWLAYHYTKQYLSSSGYTLDQQTYLGLLGAVRLELLGSRTITFVVGDKPTSIFFSNIEVDQQGYKEGFPAYSVTTKIYVPSERAGFSVSFSVVLPVRYYLAQQMLTAVSSLPNGSNTQQVVSAIEPYFTTLQQVWGTLTIHSAHGSSTVELSLVDCYLEEYYQACPIYLGSESVAKVFPNLTLSLPPSS